MNPKYTNYKRYKCLEYLKKQSLDLYLIYCGIEECDPCHSYGPTCRSEYLIHYILNGKGIFKVDGKTYNIGKYEAFIIYPNEMTFYEADKDEPWTYLWIGFNGIKADTCLNYATFSKENRCCRFECYDTLLNCVEGMLNSSQLTYANDLKRESYLLSFLSAIINEKRSNVEETHDYPNHVLVEQGLDFIEHNYNRSIRINDIANYIGISRTYLSSIFKKNLNMSPQEYLVNYRLNKACNLLKTTNFSVSSIAVEVGYDDPLTFSKIFKRFYSESPSTYRINNKEVVKTQCKGE